MSEATMSFALLRVVLVGPGFDWTETRQPTARLAGRTVLVGLVWLLGLGGAWGGQGRRGRKGSAGLEGSSEVGGG